MKTVTKKDVARHTARLLNEKFYTTERIVDGIFNTLRDMLSETKNEVRIEIRNFGAFGVKKTKPKPKARNPRTGKIVYVPARKKVHFRAGKLLKESLKKPLKEE